VDVKVSCAGLVVSSELAEEVPDSELVKALHAYTAEFFDREGVMGECARRFEETALLALGITVVSVEVLI